MAPANKALLPAFESIRDDSEQILWTGKPKFIPFIFSEASLRPGTCPHVPAWLNHCEISFPATVEVRGDTNFSSGRQRKYEPRRRNFSVKTQAKV